MPDPADAVLAPVLREAVTNVLRHSTAKTCTIQTAMSDGMLRLRVSNDGATEPRSTEQPVVWAGPGCGLANIAARVQAAGGRLTSGYEDGRFHLSAELTGSDATCGAELAARQRS